MSKLIAILAKEFSSVIAFGSPAEIAAPSNSTDPMPDSIVWMPAGRRTINAGTVDGAGFLGEIHCDEAAYRAVHASFTSIKANGGRVYLDLNHDDGAASAWVKFFSWDPARGIIAHVDWTPRGESALRGKEYYSFSPSFYADEHGRVHGLIPGHAAGGLVNAPAFGSAMPALIAARSGGVPSKQPDTGGNPVQHPMKEKLIAIFAAHKITVPADATEDTLLSILAKHFEGNAAESTTLKAITALQSDLAATKAKAEADAAEAAKVAAVQAKAAADAAKVAADKQAETERKLSEIAAVQAAMQSGGGNVQIVGTSPDDALLGYALAGDAKSRGEFFRDKVAAVVAKIGGREFSLRLRSQFAVLAKHSGVQAANSLGTLTGNLIAQQALALLKYKFPVLKAISTDFSNQSVDFNQSVKTRLKGALSASQYTGSAYTAANATTNDVTLTINHHPYCQVGFNANELASTNRDLFGEQAEVVNYAIALDIVNALYALITAGNFTTTPLTVTGTTGASYGRSSAIAAAQQLFVNQVPEVGRFNLLNAYAFGGLAQDPAIVSLAAFQKPDIIEGYELPPIAGMQPIQAVNLPTTGSMVGFAAAPRALALATRVPNDYTAALPGSNYGNVSTVTDPDIGITVMVTQYVDHNAGTSNYRVALMYGVAVGDPVAGIITTHS